MKKSISIFLALLLLAFCAVPAFATGEGVTALKINPYGGDEGDIDTVSWVASSGKYFLFLPADTDLSAAKVYFTASDDVTLDGAPVASGDFAAAFTAGEHTLVSGDRSYPLTVMLSANIPAVYITTQSGSLDYIHANKENKEPGNIRIYEDGVKTLDKELKQIKGRGNATWFAPKKPYNIKFDKKTDLFGMGKAKKWTLLANCYDESLLRNVYGWEYAKAFGLHYSSEYKHVDLYVNGAYLGNYVICESVEIDSERIDLNDLEKANENANPGVDLETLPRGGTGPNGTVQSGAVKGSAKWINMPASPETLSGGYLLELELADRYDAELCGFVADVGQPVVIKSPELASEAEVRYIGAIVNDAMNALYSETGYNAAGKHYSEYFDMEALVNMYILQELAANLDAGVTSTFLYKSQDSDKLVFSPVWDFDHAYGDSLDRFGSNIGNPNGWWANALAWPHRLVFNAAFRHGEIKQSVRERWTTLDENGIITGVAAEVKALSAALAASAQMNLVRWNAGVTNNPASAAGRYASLVNTGDTFLAQRRIALTKGFAADAAMLYYDANGGSGYIFNPQIASVGDSVTVIGPDRDLSQISAPDSTHIFNGWNTKADGSGTAYQPGSSIVLMQNETVLYAQWKNTQATEPTTDPATTDPTPPASSDNDGGSHDSSGNYLQWLRHILQEIVNFWRRVFRIK